MKVAFYTLGCKVNQYETQLMRENLQNAGFEIAESAQNADVYVINSCTVTAVSNQKTRQALRAFKRKHPQAITVLAGCMSQAYPEEAAALPEADIIIGNTEHKHLPQLLHEYAESQSRLMCVYPHESSESFESGIIHNFEGKTRAEVKIEDGCNRFCTYCAIPYARGRVRSKPLEALVKEIKALAAAGYKEIVLVGINLSAYNDNGADLADAVALTAATAGIERVRLGSLEPDHITPAMIQKLAAVPQFCPQFHISLQSGCNRTLKAMNRHYTAEEYRTLCAQLRAAFPECTLTTDVMTGFPGESEEDFEASLDFVREIGFEKLHVFPYSRREGTKAATMPAQIEKSVKAARAKKMIALGAQIREQSFRAQIGKTCEVLFESKKGEQQLGYTKNYIPVRCKAAQALQGTLKTVKIIAADSEGCDGEIL